MSLGWIIFLVWLVVFIPFAVHAQQRLNKSIREGFIANPGDIGAWLAMMLKVAAWPYSLPKYLYLVRKHKKR